MMSVEHLVEWLAGETEVLGGNLPQYHRQSTIQFRLRKHFSVNSWARINTDCFVGSSYRQFWSMLCQSYWSLSILIRDDTRVSRMALSQPISVMPSEIVFRLESLDYFLRRNQGNMTRASAMDFWTHVYIKSFHLRRGEGG
jgi:hypothetical protein